MSVLDDFSSWKDFLSNKVSEAKDHGMGSQAMTNVAQQVGEYLSRHVEPQNEEERVLQDLWNAASPEEQKAIASSMIKLVQKNG